MVWFISSPFYVFEFQIKFLLMNAEDRRHLITAFVLGLIALIFCSSSPEWSTARVRRRLLLPPVSTVSSALRDYVSGRNRQPTFSSSTNPLFQ